MEPARLYHERKLRFHKNMVRRHAAILEEIPTAVIQASVLQTRPPQHLTADVVSSGVMASITIFLCIVHFIILLLSDGRYSGPSVACISGIMTIALLILAVSIYYLRKIHMM